MPSQSRRKPHYESDRVGPVLRVDERDTLFARADLSRKFPEGSLERETYYARHPEALEYDRRMAEELEIGGGGGEYAQLVPAVFELCRAVADESAVAGDGAADGGPPPQRVALSPEEAARRVKALALALGADLVRTGPLNPEWVYSNVGRSFGSREGFAAWGEPVDLSHHTDAVSMGFRMDTDFTKTAPEFPTVVATSVAYAIGAFAAVRLARYIRSLGYSARAHHVYSYRVLPVPVAVDCGLGELSRAGFLMTKELGLGLRLGTVTTDLPLAHDAPADVGIQSFCERCKICAEYCPSGAIPRGEKTEHNGILKWKLEEQNCYRYWSVVSTDCSICMATCPWTKPGTWLHRGLTALAAVRGPHQSVMVAAERLFYGRPDKRHHGRSTGLETLRPTHLRVPMRQLGILMIALAAAGTGWGLAGADAGAPLGPGGWIAYLFWLGTTLLGIAAVWTFLAERTVRPALVALGLFGLISAVVGSLLVW